MLHPLLGHLLLVWLEFYSYVHIYLSNSHFQLRIPLYLLCWTTAYFTTLPNV